MLPEHSSWFSASRTGQLHHDRLERGNMKKLIAASVLALLVLASSQQSASAWCNFKFGVGLNFEYSGGNNCLLWGLHRSGQVPDGYFAYYPQGPVAGPMADWY